MRIWVNREALTMVYINSNIVDTGGSINFAFSCSTKGFGRFF